MSDSGEHGYITFGWIATIIGVLLFFAILESKHSDAQKSAEYAYKCAQQYKRSTTPTSNINTLTSDQVEPKSTKIQENKPDWCDLAAQQSMAESTQWMNWATWATVIFTGAGIFLIWLTLREAQRTTRAAIGATNAAITANRAWMKLLPISKGRIHITQGGMSSELDSRFKNIGKMVATHVEITQNIIHVIGNKEILPKRVISDLIYMPKKVAYPNSVVEGMIIPKFTFAETITTVPRWITVEVICNYRALASDITNTTKHVYTIEPGNAGDGINGGFYIAIRNCRIYEIGESCKIT